jgi:DNA-binding GntR family transcriptional regulator
MEILSGRLIPGARIRMSDFAEEHEVSMGAVREALSRLAAEHMVIAAAQRGYTVATLSVNELTDLTSTRIAIEQLCMRGSIEGGGVEWEAALLASHYRLQRLSEFELSDRSRISEDWSRAHGDFHLALVAGCRSPWLHKFRASLYLQTERYRQLSVPLRTIDRDVAGEHQALCDAALARDAAGACELMRTHLLKTTEILLDSPLLSALSAAERQAALLEG